jgi:hypothetical protein
MAGAESSIVLLPRFTTLYGKTAETREFTTLPLDVSRFGSAQFQFWRGPICYADDPVAFYVALEESLDAEHWVLGTSAPTEFEVPEDTPLLFSYAFRLRWFRLRAKLDTTGGMVTCWAEGPLR